MLCPSVISRFGTLADKQRFDAASAMGQTRSSGDVASGLPSESGRAVDIPERQVRADIVVKVQNCPVIIFPP
jgi:hypothetical protein